MFFTVITETDGASFGQRFFGVLPPILVSPDYIRPGGRIPRAVCCGLVCSFSCRILERFTRGPCSLPLAARLGPKKPRASCAALSSSQTAGIQDVETRVEPAIVSVALRFLPHGNVEDTWDGDRSVACDRRLSVLAEIDVLLYCIENLVRVLCPNI